MKNKTENIKAEQEAREVIEQTTSAKGIELLNAVSDGHMSAVAAVEQFKKQCPKEYAKIMGKVAAPPAAKAPASKGKKEVIITISLTEAGAEYGVDAHNCEVPDGFPLKGTREIKKAKGIVSRCVYDFGFAAAPSGKRDD